jgi:predicted N-formylglutamate amidohydrolase
MTPKRTNIFENTSQVLNQNGSSSVVLVCEHATHFIPDVFNNLGLSSDNLRSHAAWDPGAQAVTQHLSRALDAVMVQGVVSRLVYDCNRPPSSPDAMPERSEIVQVPGNRDLSKADRATRVQQYYEPFRSALARQISKIENPIIVTIHSFTPIYHGKPRDVEIGILHDSDNRLANAMLATGGDHSNNVIRRNQPYGSEHGVTHTLTEHAIPNGHLNVMLEIRNDLIETQDQQNTMAQMISVWLVDACNQIKVKGNVQCVA